MDFGRLVDEWASDEARYSRNPDQSTYTGPSPVSQGIFDRAARTSEASAEAAEAIREMSERLSADEGIDPYELGVRISGSDRDAICNMDETEIMKLFDARMQYVDMCIAMIREDELMPGDVGSRVVNAAFSVMKKLRALAEVVITRTRFNRVRGEAPEEAGDVDSAQAAWIRNSLDVEEPTLIMSAYLHVLKEAMKLGYARYGDGFVRRVVTPAGLMTNAWKKECTFKDFVRRQTMYADPVVRRWLISSPAMVENISKMLSTNMELCCPWISKDRHVFAFSNGCYMADKELFIPFSAAAPPVMPDGSPCPTACKYHDQEVDPLWLTCDDWTAIPTPTMDRVMDTQMLKPMVKRCYYSMLGRVIYYVKEKDNWQVALYVKGQAETGKSTLFTHISHWYEVEDIGTLASNVEEKFGASMLVGKYIVIGDDIGEDFSMDQQLFQNMVSGNPVSCPAKNASAINITWNIPFLLSGNLLPGYKDNGGGSFSRRLFIISYTKPVIRVDPELPARLDLEIVASIIKCNRAYMSMVRRLAEARSRGITFWEAIPEEFKLEKLNAMQSANPLMHFLNSGKIAIPPLPKSQTYMPIEEFRKAFMEHCTENNLTRPKWIPSTYDGPFTAMNLEVHSRSTRLRYPRPNGPEISCKWIFGCDLASTNTMSLVNMQTMAAADKVQAAINAADQQDPAPPPGGPSSSTGGRKRPAPPARQSDQPPQSIPRI